MVTIFKYSHHLGTKSYHPGTKLHAWFSQSSNKRVAGRHKGVARRDVTGRCRGGSVVRRIDYWTTQLKVRE